METSDNQYKEMKSDNGYTNMAALSKDFIRRLQESVVNDETPDVSSGFQRLDALIGGFENGKVYVVGGRPCMGKEELILSMIRNITMEEVPVLLFSTNQRKQDYVQRLLSIHCDIPTLRLQQGRMEALEWERLEQRIGSITDVPLFIHDSLDLPLSDLEETAKGCLRDNGVRIIFIDCLQMIDFSEKDETSPERIARVMISLKRLASMLELPIVVGSMLSRSVDYKSAFYGKCPRLSDLLYSGYVEELADVVIMVYRPEYYHIYEDERGRDLHGLIEIEVKKNALRSLGGISMDYHQKTGAICERNMMGQSTSPLISLAGFEASNSAVRRLVQTLSLEELGFSS